MGGWWVGRTLREADPSPQADGRIRGAACGEHTVGAIGVPPFCPLLCREDRHDYTKEGKISRQRSDQSLSSPVYCPFSRPPTLLNRATTSADRGAMSSCDPPRYTLVSIPKHRTDRKSSEVADSRVSSRLRTCP